MSGTDDSYSATRMLFGVPVWDEGRVFSAYESAMRCPVLTYERMVLSGTTSMNLPCSSQDAIFLCTCYARLGTDLRARDAICYAISGTDLAYAATSNSALAYQRTRSWLVYSCLRCEIKWNTLLAGPACTRNASYRI
eukprot:3940745-Rhodomonas_salina.27